jgi:uncharacterized OsmC-like protein
VRRETGRGVERWSAAEREREREREKERVGRERSIVPDIAISISSPVNSHKCLRVLLFSARNTGPISYTLSMSAEIAICLYNWGDWARQAGWPK